MNISISHDINVEKNVCVHMFMKFNRNYYYSQVNSQESDFAPQVSATCKANVMNIKILFNTSYNGAVHARDFRKQYCMTYGNGSSIVTMSLNLLANQGSDEYCGILVSNIGKDVRRTF